MLQFYCEFKMLCWHVSKKSHKKEINDIILHCPGPVAKNQHLDDTQYTIAAFVGISPSSWAIHVSSTGCIMTIFRTARRVSRFVFSLVFRYLIVTLRILSSLLNSTSLILPYWYVLLRFPSFFRNKITSPTLTSRSLLNYFGWNINFGTCDNSQFSNQFSNNARLMQFLIINTRFTRTDLLKLSIWLLDSLIWDWTIWFSLLFWFWFSKLWFWLIKLWFWLFINVVKLKLNLNWNLIKLTIN